MTTNFTTADYAVLAGFFLVMLAIGVIYARRMKNLKDFFSGGKHVPWWISGISLYMTTFSAFTFVSYSAVAYKAGFVAVAIWWFGIPGCLLSAWFLAARWRRAATTSPLEYLEKRFNPFLRQGFGLLGVPLIAIDDGLKLFVIGKMITVSLGWTHTSALEWAIIACGGLILVYTFLGGLWAVMITDFIQFIVMAAAVLVLAPLAMAKVGGLGAFFDQLPNDMFHVVNDEYDWSWQVAFFFVIMLTYMTKWPYVQRFYSVRTDKEARWVGYTVAALLFIGPPILFAPAMAARIFMPDIPANELNNVYPMVCAALLPAGMMGIVIAAMFSATMSMMSSDYNSVASVLTNDVVKRFFLPNASERAQVLLARLSTLVVGVVAIALALVLARAEDLEDLVKIMAQVFSVLLPPIAIPMVAGLVTRRASSAGATWGFLLGAACSLSVFSASYLIEDLAYLRTVRYLTWISIVPTLAGLAAGSWFMPDGARKREVVDAFMDSLTVVEPPRVPTPLETQDVALGMRIIGGAMAAMGLILAVTVLIAHGGVGLSFGVGVVMAVGGGLTVWRSVAKERRASAGA